MDRLTPERRSALMGRVGSKDTSPELLLRRFLWSLGLRYRVHVGTLPGRPDIVIPALRKVILVHGCFWHGHRRCKHGKLPKSKLRYWGPKIEGNIARDARHRRALRAMGWKALVIWECQMREPRRFVDRLLPFLDS